MNNRTRSILLSSFVLIIIAIGIFVLTRPNGGSGDVENPTISSAVVNDSIPTSTNAPTISSYFGNKVLAEIDDIAIFDHLIGMNEDGRLIFSVQFRGEGNLKTFVCQSRIDETGYDIISPQLNVYETQSGVIEGYVKGVGRDFDGNYYVIHQFTDSSDAEVTVLNTYDKDFSPISENIPWVYDNSTGYSFYTSVKVFGDKIYATKDNLEIHNMQGEMLTPPSGLQNYVNTRACDIDRNGNLYLLQQHNIVKYDIAEDNEVYIYEQNNSGSSDMTYCEYDDCIYYAIKLGIYKFDPTTMTVSQAVEFGKDTDYIPTNIGDHQLRGIIIDKNSNFYTATNCYSTKGSKLYRIFKSEGTRPDETERKTLTLTAVYPQDFLIEAIAKYEMENKAIHIELETLFSTREELLMDQDKAKTWLTTKMMTNDVGDIVATGGMGLTYYDAFQTDAFVNLTDYIKSDENYPKLNLNFLGAISLNNELKGLPLGIKVPKLAYNKELGAALGLDINHAKLTWSEVLTLAQKLAKEHPEVYIFDNSLSLETLLSYILISNQPDIIDTNSKNVDIKQPWFLEIISELKIASKTGTFIKPPSTDATWHWSSAVSADCLFGSASESLYLADEFYKYSKSDFEVEITPWFFGEQNRNSVGYPFIMYSISNNSSNKSDAWDFLSFLLDENIQTQGNLYSIPLNNEALFTHYKYSQLNAELQEQFSESIVVDYLYDYGMFKPDMQVPLTDYIDDKISLDEAIKKAEYNVWLRLNE